MTYDELSEKLRMVKLEYSRLFKHEMKTIAQLEKYLELKLVKKKTHGLKSLKGLF